MNEAETRAKLINPTLRGRGWTDDLIKREESAGEIEIGGGKPRRRQGRVDYTLRVKIAADAQGVAVALIEAKADYLPPHHGLEQAKAYADSRRLNVPFVFSTNGHLYVEYSRFTGHTGAALPLADFPTPDALRQRYEAGMGFSLDEAAARPLSTRPARGEAGYRYYQDAAVRAVFEKLARCEHNGEPPRALLSLATGTGKTRIAVEILRRLADAGQLKRALFVCDRDELRKQAAGALHDAFGADAQPVTAGDPQMNARVLIATYQTLGLEGDDAEASFLMRHYPPDYFTHIIIDECHRSAWGKWSQVLTHNPSAVQIGLTATPRRIVHVKSSPEVRADRQTTADNVAHFGEPVYEYELGQGIEDGYLAACEIVQRDIFLDRKRENERASGLGQGDLTGKAITDARTGETLSVAEARERYEAPSFEAQLVLPERVRAMCEDLFEQIVRTDKPEQKTIVFCARDDHADRVAAELNNLYADWHRMTGQRPAAHYAFKCTAASGGADLVSELKAAPLDYYIATTVELLTTGVDVPAVRNIVFMKYVRSPIAFYQMIGRGTRLDPPTQKLMFRVYDYTDATRLFGEAFLTRAAVKSEAKPKAAEDEEPAERERVLQVAGFDVQVTDAGHLILTQVEGRAVPVTVEEYRERLAERLVAEAPTLDAFRTRWIEKQARRELLDALPDGVRSAEVVQALGHLEDCDLYDVLADLAYGQAPHTRDDRALLFAYKHASWLESLPDATRATILALAGQFRQAGTDGLENDRVFKTPAALRAGGLAALQAVGTPADVLRETKERMFAA